MTYRWSAKTHCYRKSRDNGRFALTGRTQRAARPGVPRLRFEHLEPRHLLVANPLITEVMANNDRTLADGSQPPQYPDWFELYNAGDQAIDLVGWHATDDPTELEKWTFPNEVLDPGEFLVVFASGAGDNLPDSRDPGGNLHTSFQLNSEGENLALVKPDGITVAFEFEPRFPRQFQDHSFGFGFEPMTLVSTGDPVRILVPLDDSLAATWTGNPVHEPFEETSWTTGTTRVGFGDAFVNSSAAPHPPSLITGVTVATSSPSDPGDGEHHLVDGSGLFNSVSSGSDNKLYHDNSSAGGLHWVMSASTGSITFDLGAVYDVDVMHLWNLNDREHLDRGVNQLELRASTTGANAAIATNFESVVASLPIDSGLGPNSFSFYRGENYRFNGLSLGEAQAVNPLLHVGEHHDFSDLTLRARFIRFDGLTSPGSKIGLSEVQFYGKPVDHGQTVDPFLNQIVIPLGNTHVIGSSPAVAGNDEDNVVNGTGLMNSANFGGPDKLFHQNDNVPGLHWLMSQQTGSIVFDLGAEHDIDVMHIWNFNNLCCTEMGTGAFDLQISSTGTSAADATGFQRVAPPVPISPGTGGGNFYRGENYRFNGLTLSAAQAVNPLLDTTTNHDLSQVTLRGRFIRFSGMLSSGTQVGLSEVQFHGRPVGGVALGTDIGPQMLQVNSTAYLRTSFTVENPADVDSLTLRVKYNDGFVAYVNGQEVARRNALGLPEQPLSFNATATDERFFIDAIRFEEIDVSAHVSSLHAGDNVLAIQGLNASIDDDDFLILPELVAGTLNAQEMGYFLQPTPGAANGRLDRPIGPVIENVTHTPNQPTAADDLVITATMTEAGAAISNISLHYRVMYGSEATAAMNDSGTEGDAVAQDSVYTGVVTAAQLNSALVASGGTSGQLGGKMIRYYVTATDNGGRTSRAPVFLDPTESAEYFGTVVIEPTVNASLPFYQWFTQDEAAADTGVGTRASFFHDGEFHDNIFVRIRGGVSRVWPKKSYKFEFNDDHHFLFDPNEDRVDEINVNGTYPEKTYVRGVLAMEALAAAGVPTPVAFNVRMHRNGKFYSVSFFVEQVDPKFLRRNDLDSDGALYKLKVNSVGGLQTNFGDKKTRQDEDRGDLQSLVDGVAPTNANRSEYLLDNIDLPKVINYMATMQVLGDVDYSEKNFFLYRDTEGTGEWFVIPWDKDLSFGQPDANQDTVWADDDSLPSGPAAPMHPFFGSTGFSETPTGGRYFQRVNYLMDAIIATPATREMYLRRLRTLMDVMLKPPGSPDPSFFDIRRDQLQSLLGPDVSDDLARWASPWPWGANLSFSQGLDKITEDYLPRRRVHLFQHHSIQNPGFPNNAGIPDAQLENLQIEFGEIEVHPGSGNQDEAYIRLDNPHAAAVDISGWRLEGTVRFAFQPGTVIPAGESLYVSPNVNAFRGRTEGPGGGQGLFVQGGYEGHLNNPDAMIQLFAADNELIATVDVPNELSTAQRYLRITELHYHPQDPTPAELAIVAGATEDDFEFVELQNNGPQTLDLRGVGFTAGVEFRFGADGINTLEPGQFVLVVANQAAFEARYGTGLPVAGEPTEGKFSDQGERVILVDALDGAIHDFAYDDLAPWPEAADGDGPSLVVIDVESDYGDSANWRVSAAEGGNPAITTLAGDFDNDGDLDGNDIDALSAEIMASTHGVAFDVTDDGQVDLSDLQHWVLDLKATQFGDANLDGMVNGVDFNTWNGHKFTTGNVWSTADFNADGVTDFRDFNLWNGNKLFAVPVVWRSITADTNEADTDDGQARVPRAAIGNDLFASAARGTSRFHPRMVDLNGYRDDSVGRESTVNASPIDTQGSVRWTTGLLAPRRRWNEIDTAFEEWSMVRLRDSLPYSPWRLHDRLVDMALDADQQVTPWCHGCVSTGNTIDDG